MIDKAYAVEQVRIMAYQFADLYFEFCHQLRAEFGEQTALELARRVLFERARERAAEMVKKAESLGVARVPDAIHDMSNVAYLGWVAELGAAHCPYGAKWNERIADNEWFRKFAALYCDVTDTTIAEVFTGTHSHKLYKNIVLGDDSCEREYFPDERVARGEFTFGK